MNKTALFLLLAMLTVLVMLAGQAGASTYFRVVYISPIIVAPNSQSNFTADVKGLGSEGEYVQLIFKNVSEGLTVAQTDKIKYVFPAGTRSINCTIWAGDIPEGNYSFDVGIAARGAPASWVTAYANVQAEVPEVLPVVVPGPVSEPSASENLTESQTEAPREMPDGSERNEASRLTPGPGAIATIAALALASRKLLS